jgi:hypothetical protein
LALAAAPAGAAQVPTIKAKPGLKPGFRNHISDYTTFCSNSGPVVLSVEAPGGVSVSVDGGPARSGDFTANLAIGWGQQADIVVRRKGKRRRHHVRCVPPDFPRWKYKRFRRPAAQWYLMAPVGKLGTPQPTSHYMAMIDGRGVPVWWDRQPRIPFNTMLLKTNELAFSRWYGGGFGKDPGTAWVIGRLDGTAIRAFTTKGSPTDSHDFQPLPNGNFMLMTYRFRDGVDTRILRGGEKDGAVWDGELQEHTPNGELVWTWNSKDHMKLSENVNWRFAGDRPDGGRKVHDYFHLNSVEPDGDSYIISVRHLDAVYRIDRDTGKIDWKLGGSPHPKSLKVKGDHVQGPFIGQHDARLEPDGTLTVFDNHVAYGTPRAVRYRIDAQKRTATLLDEITEPAVTFSAAEGSARRHAKGAWAVSWGATPYVTERTAKNKPIWRLTLDQAQNYRVQPIAYGRLKRHELRRAMNVMNPRP